MANIKQQKKRIGTAQRQRLENLRYRSTIKTMFRSLQDAVDKGDAETATTVNRELVALLDRSSTRGALHRNTASRKKARAARMLLQEPKKDTATVRRVSKKKPARATAAAKAAAGEKPEKKAAAPKADKKAAAPKAEKQPAKAAAEEAPVEEVVEAPAAEAAPEAEAPATDETPAAETSDEA